MEGSPQSKLMYPNQKSAWLQHVQSSSMYIPLMLHVLVIGSGSAAQTYVRVLLRGFDKIRIDIFSRSKSSTANRFQAPGIVRILDSEPVPEVTYDLVIVASRTASHLLDIKEFGSFGSLVLCEKPLTGNLKDLNSGLGSVAQEHIFVSSPLRQMQSFEHFSRLLLKYGAPRVITIHCESDLRTWRTGRDAADGYWSNLGEGGVLRELIHELDYGLYLFGEMCVARAKLERSKTLQIQSESRAEAKLVSNRGTPINLHLSWDSLSEKRYCRVSFAGKRLEWDILGDSVTEIDERNFRSRLFSGSGIRDDTFLRQIRSVLQLDSSATPVANFQEALNAISLVEKIEEKAFDRFES